MTGAAAAVMLSCSAFLLVPGRDASLARLGDPSAIGGSTASRFSRQQRRLGLLGTGGVLLVVWTGGGGRLVLIVIASVATLAVVRKVVGLWRLRHTRQQHRRAAISLCDSLAAELRGGLPALSAVTRSCHDSSDLAPVLSAARLGADIPAALRTCATAPGADGLRAVAAAWEVAASSGAALAGVLEQLAVSLRSDEDARAEVAATLGPPRATAKMLAGLPLAGIAMGESMGADPVSFLLGTSWGLGCLSAGLVLALLGVWWVELLASSAER